MDNGGKNRYIRTPKGEVFKYEDCDDFYDDFCETTEVFSYIEDIDNTENQQKLAEELFKQTGILVG